MMKRSRLGSTLAGVAIVATSACAGLTQMQDTAAKFDQGVHTASAAELSLFTQNQAAECSRTFYLQGFEFAVATPDPKTHHYPVLPLDLRSSACVHQELTDDQLAIRQKLMQTMTLYADAIQTLTNGTNDANLSDNAKTLAGDIKALGTQQKFTSVGSNAAAALNTAVVAIATMIIDHTSYKHVKDAASAMQAPLETVVKELKAENLADATGLSSKTDSLLNEVRTGLSAARDRFGAVSFLYILSARATVQSLIVSPPNVKQLNETLDAIVKANAALARSNDGGAIPEISDLISRAQQASTLFNAWK
jgi:hypothetical protein